MIDEIKQAAKGDWLSIMKSFGLPELNTKNEGPCIFCGGKSRARWIENKEYYFCSHCDSRSRDGIQMIKDYNNMSFVAVKTELADLLGVKKQKVSSSKMTEIKRDIEKGRYLKAVRYTLLASNHRFQLTQRENHWNQKAQEFVAGFRKKYPNYINWVGI